MRHLIILIMLSWIFAGCERLLMKPEPANNAAESFEHMWHTLDTKYSFFTFKRINWDSIYQVYRPQVNNEMTTRELYDLLADLLYELRDGHVNLITPFDYSRNWTWYLNSPQNFNYTNVERNYLGPNHEITGPLRNNFIDSVGYVYYSSFSSGIASSQIDYIVQKYKNMKGLIFDVRDNGGGSTTNVDRLIGRFLDQPRVLSYERFKSGPGHDDFTELYPRTHEPEGDEQFTKPIIVLTNRSSYSASNDFVMKMSAIPHVTILGDTTGGGGGFPYYSELPNGWKFRFSSTQSFTVDNFNVEDGIPPDILVELNKFDEFAGKDTLIEEALKLLQ